MNVYEYLLSYNVKPSVQRIAIMDYLLKHKTHPSIDEIYLALSKSIPTLSKTTVYNTLKLLTENGAAQMRYARESIGRITKIGRLLHRRNTGLLQRTLPFMRKEETEKRKRTIIRISK